MQRQAHMRAFCRAHVGQFQEPHITAHTFPRMLNACIVGQVICLPNLLDCGHDNPRATGCEPCRMFVWSFALHRLCNRTWYRKSASHNHIDLPIGRPFPGHIRQSVLLRHNYRILSGFHCRLSTSFTSQLPFDLLLQGRDVLYHSSRRVRRFKDRSRPLFLTGQMSRF